MATKKDDDFNRRSAVSHSDDSDPLWRDPMMLLLVGALGATYVLANTPEHKAILKTSLQYESSPIDWCEDNYVAHPWIAEFWNTLSSLPFVFLAPLGWWYTRTLVRKVDHQLAMLWITLGLVGLGSLYFHITLSRLGQIFDEVTICWLNFYGFGLVLPRKRFGRLPIRRRWLFSPFFKLAIMLCTPILGLCFPWVSHALTVFTLPMLVAVLVIQYRTCTALTNRIRGFFFTALLCTILAVVCWVVDRTLCDPMSARRDIWGYFPQCHALWHIFIFTGAWLAMACGMFFRSHSEGFDASIETPDMLGCVKGLPLPVLILRV